MRRTKTKEDKALDEALDVLIARSGHSPDASRAFICRTMSTSASRRFSSSSSHDRDRVEGSAFMHGVSQIRRALTRWKIHLEED
jgi:hypothetical protein